MRPVGTLALGSPPPICLLSLGRRDREKQTARGTVFVLFRRCFDVVRPLLTVVSEIVPCAIVAAFSLASDGVQGHRPLLPVVVAAPGREDTRMCQRKKVRTRPSVSRSRYIAIFLFRVSGDRGCTGRDAYPRDGLADVEGGPEVGQGRRKEASCEHPERYGGGSQG